METRSSMSRSLHTNRDLEKLEPYEGKPSCTVLRGEEGSNALDLPDLGILNRIILILMDLFYKREKHCLFRFIILIIL